VTIENPFNYQDFHDDKLSVLDVRAVDDAGAIYNVEVQLRVRAGQEKRLVFYGCELYAGQFRQGASYPNLPPVYSIWLIDGLLWPGTPQFHHAFRLTDGASGRILDGTLAIHTIEPPKYNTAYSDLTSDDLLGWWLYWLRQAGIANTGVGTAERRVVSHSQYKLPPRYHFRFPWTSCNPPTNMRPGSPPG